MSVSTKSRKVFYPSPGRVVVGGKITKGITAVVASATWPVTAAGKDLIFKRDAITGMMADELGTKHVAATADGTAKATCPLTVGAAAITPTYVNGGVSGNGHRIYLVPGGTAGAEVMTIGGTDFFVSYQASVSTATQIAAAIEAHANWTCADPVSAEVTTGVLSALSSGGTAAEYVVWATSAPHLTLHFTDGATTTAQMVTAAADTGASGYANKFCTLSLDGTGVSTNVLTNATEAFSNCHFNAIPGTTAVVGVTAVAATVVLGTGFTVSNVSAGIVRVTLTDRYQSMIAALCSISAASAADSIAMVKGFSSTYCDFRVTDINASPTLTAADATLYIALILKRTTA